MKRTISFILALVLLIGLLPMQAFATEVSYDQLSTAWPSINTDLTHIICYGQSFSTGSDAPYYDDPTVDNVYVYGSITNSSKGTELTHLTGSAGNQHPIISAGNVLAQLLTGAGIDTDIILGSYGSGGKTIAQLMSDERQAEIKEEEGYTYDILSSGRYEIFQGSVSALAQYAQKNEQSISCPAIVYLQGETDQNTDAQLGYPENPARAGYGAGGDKEKYKEYMSRLKEDMQREVMEQYGQTEKPLFIIYQVSGTYTRTQYSSINMAQIEFAQENEDVILVQSPYFTSHYTNSHHLTQNGYRWLGEYIGHSMYTALVKREKPWPMLPESIEVTGKNTVRITVKGAQNGLTIDTWTVENASNNKNLYGFYVQSDGKIIVPTEVSVRENIIELTLSANLTSETVYVYYAGKHASGTGNIRDNCAELGFYEYLDDSNDTGTGNNQGVSHSSLDANGNSIIGQKYPMYNWLSAFCYEVEVPEPEQRHAAYYHWEMQESGLVSVTDGNATENNLTLVQGSVVDGVLNKVQYTMAQEIVLEHDRPWVIEWKAAGNGNSYYGGKFLNSTSSDSHAQYLYIPADSRGMVAWGVSSDSANYGFQLNKMGIDYRKEHTYRIENRIADDGVNTIYLIVDGVEIGAMTTGYRTSANSSGSAGSMIEEPKNWANGKDLFVNGIGASGSFLLNNMKLFYLKVWENGQHTHSYESVITAPTCTEQGYTTYTCDCGDSYVADYVDAEGEHDFTEWSIIKEAAYNADGEESRKCNKCSHVEFRSVSVSVVISGNLGKGTTPTDKVIYTLYSDGTMVLEGTGALFGIDWRGDNQPFIDYRKQVKHLIIGEGITSTTSGSLVKLSNLETIQFPSTLTHLPQNALMSCFRPDITKLTIPATVVHLGAYSIGHYTGDNSAYFTDVIIENPNIQITDHNAVFNGGAKLDQLTLYSYGANNKVSAYAEKYGIRYVDLNNYLEGEYGDIHYELSDGILILEPLADNAYVPAGDNPWASYAESITKIIVGEGIVSIPQNAFVDYPALTTVDLPSGLDSIGDGAFSVTQNNATSLTMTLPRHLNSLGKDIFKGRNNVELTVYSDSLGADLAEPGVKLITKKVFKLMLIGNSYSEDASNGTHTTGSQLLDILQAMLGEDAEITVALLSSGGKGMHWHATQAEQGNTAYSFKVITSNNPVWKSQGSYTSADALAWTDWDVVSLQPYNINVSTGQESVPYPDSTDPKFYHIEDSSSYMLDHVARYAPYADIYFYMHWAQTSSTVLNAALSNYNKAAAFMPQVLDFAGIESGVQFKDIIPVGLSIQNARTTYLALLRYNTTAYADGNLNLITDAQIGLQRDGGHVSFNIGRYIAALTFAETIIPAEMRAEGYVLPDIRVTESVGQLPKEYSELAQKSVFAAVNGWKNGNLAVTNIEGYTQDPTVAASEMLKKMELSLSLNDTAIGEEQIRTMVLAALPADFVVENVVVNTEEKIATVTIRFGYTSATVEMMFTVVGPVITKQPTDVTANLGEKFKITVEAEGEDLTYQWYYSNNGGKSFSVSSFKTNTYSMTMANYCHKRQVYCVITDANGNSVQTDTVTITRPPLTLTIVTQPTGVQAEIGQKFSIKVDALGDGLTYQWYYKDGKEFKESSRKTNTYAMTMANYMDGRQVYCVITDKYGNSVTTETVTISLPPVALTIVKQPQDVQVEIGDKVKITVEATGDGLTYQWYYKDRGSKEFKVSSYKSSSYTMTMASYCHGRQVYCVITDRYGNTVTTETATMTRPPVELKILTQPTDVSGAVGKKFSVNFTVQGEGLTYQWYYKNKGDKTFRVSTYKSSAYAMTMANYMDGRQVYCVITDQYGNQVTTEVVTIHVEK